MKYPACSLWLEELLQGAVVVVVVVIVPDPLTGRAGSVSEPNSSSDLTLIFPIIYNRYQKYSAGRDNLRLHQDYIFPAIDKILKRNS